ncbi:hypothetical protein V7O66_12995 [Methanolobus sp. ZRKC3]|uniref:COG1361 S-layer family protein n=1 Tax=Methanolobus sp. ZRKC3 TaxID=3125786 RepID=UPI00325487FE
MNLKILMVALLILVTSSSFAHADTEIRPTVSLSYDVEPEVFMPGDTGTITVTISNMATGEIYVEEDDETLDMNAYIASASLDGNGVIKILDRSYTDVGLMGPGDSLELTFNIKASNNASDSVHFLDLAIVGGSNMYDLNYRIPVKIDDRNLKVIVSDVPSNLMKEIATIGVEVVNRRPNEVTSVIVSPSGNNMEFSPSEFFIGSITEGNKSTAAFTLNTIDCDPGKGDIEFTVSYFNGDNLHSTEKVVKNVNIIDQSPLIFTSIETERAGNKYSISGDLNNFGVTDAKNVIVSIQGSDNITPVQPFASYFIGTLEADDFSSFDLSAKVLSDDISSIPVIIEFRNTDNAYTSMTKEINIAESGVGSNSEKEDSSAATWIFAAVITVAIAALIAYSWKKRKEDEAQYPDDIPEDEDEE